jgi:hypothetical protein
MVRKGHRKLPEDRLKHQHPDIVETLLATSRRRPK